MDIACRELAESWLQSTMRCAMCFYISSCRQRIISLQCPIATSRWHPRCAAIAMPVEFPVLYHGRGTIYCWLRVDAFTNERGRFSLEFSFWGAYESIRSVPHAVWWNCGDTAHHFRPKMCTFCSRLWRSRGFPGINDIWRFPAPFRALLDSTVLFFGFSEQFDRYSTRSWDSPQCVVFYIVINSGRRYFIPKPGIRVFIFSFTVISATSCPEIAGKHSFLRIWSRGKPKNRYLTHNSAACVWCTSKKKRNRFCAAVAFCDDDQVEPTKQSVIQDRYIAEKQHTPSF